mmetsp:Transcript_20898/g.26968  ORF Transcript_20898/g.26968 Transcript_20898/m.26968 type:complete len:462 (-) Transcript_20898:416-1801(-)
MNEADENSLSKNFTAESEDFSPCTYVATGPRMSFQAVFDCQTCKERLSRNENNEDEVTFHCICESCAESCHAGHDVAFIGFAPAYCDCNVNNSCCMIEKSSLLALKRGVPVDGRIMEDHGSLSKMTNTIYNSFGYQAEVTYINDFDKNCDEILRQSKLLASMDMNGNENRTMWVSIPFTDGPKSIDNLNDLKYSELEKLAISIFRRHVEYFDLKTNHRSGAEWWVQVKPTSERDEEVGSIGLHYDKDESMASTFGLGLFPTLSTVTYLSHNKSANPTIILPRTYHDAQDDDIEQIIMSHPEKGKHLAFDGRLLHGAPANPQLRVINQRCILDEGDDLRVTFLVNIWTNGKPLDAIPLSDDQRIHLSKGGAQYISMPQYDDFTSGAIACLTVNEDEVESVNIPFVASEAEWIEEEETEGGTYLSMTVPFGVQPSATTLRLRYGDNNKAHIIMETLSDDSESD